MGLRLHLEHSPATEHFFLLQCVDVCPGAVPMSGSGGVLSNGPGGVSNIIIRERLTTSVVLEWQEVGSTMYYTVQFRIQGSTDGFASLQPVSSFRKLILYNYVIMGARGQFFL